MIKACLGEESGRNLYHGVGCQLSIWSPSGNNLKEGGHGTRYSPLWPTGQMVQSSSQVAGAATVLSTGGAAGFAQGIFFIRRLNLTGLPTSQRSRYLSGRETPGSSSSHRRVQKFVYTDSIIKI
jgi:hypothetical protein